MITVLVPAALALTSHRRAGREVGLTLAPLPAGEVSCDGPKATHPNPGGLAQPECFPAPVPWCPDTPGRLLGVRSCHTFPLRWLTSGCFLVPHLVFLKK